MNYDIKTEALLETVKSFVSRGKFIQYDQRSLDRILQLTPRPRKFLPPEAATEGNTVYLDCSGYVNAIYYQAFGVELPADLTWHMVDYVKPRVYYYELTHNETAEDIKKIEAEVRAVLRIGDVITYDRGVGSGHTLMYIGDNKYTDCTTNGRPNSYDFENRRSREYESGGLWIQDMTGLFAQDVGETPVRGTLFNRNNRRFSVSRPLEIVDTPTASAISRAGAAKDLMCGVEVSHPGGVHSSKGENVTYTVFIKNLSDTKKDVTISFNPPNCTQFDGRSIINAEVLPLERAEFEFAVEVNDEKFVKLEKPEIFVNTLNVWAPEVLLGAKLTLCEIENAVSDITKEILNGSKALTAAAKIYESYGINMSDDEQQHIYNCFYLHDSTKGDVVSRRRQSPESDLAVYSLFGGIGVVTPEAATVDGIRCNKIKVNDLLAGDIILCSDDACGTTTYSSFYTGEKLVGVFEHNGEATQLTVEQTNEFIDSLFGRFCFVVLRPQLRKQKRGMNKEI